MLGDLGPLGLLVVFLMAAASVSVSLVTLGLLAAKKQGAVKVVGLLCLLTAGSALSVGALAYFLSLVGLRAALPNVPFEVTSEVLRKGTVEARANLFLAMIAAAFPWLVGSLAMILSRFRVGIGVAVVVAVGLVSMLVLYQSPLPSGKVTLATVEGLQLPSSTAQRRPGAQPLIALTPGAVWVEGSKVASIALALDHPRVRELNSKVLPLMVDGRVSFSELVDVLEAASRSKRHEFDLVVQSKEDLAVIRVRDAASLAPEAPGVRSLRLMLRVTERNVEVIAVGGALDPLPVDWLKVQDKLMEVKAAFPDERILRVTAAPEVSMDVLVKALDASRETTRRELLFPDAVLGRFEQPTLPAELFGFATDDGSEQPLEVDSDDVDRERLAAWVRGRKKAIQRCYEKELELHPTLKGKVVVLFSITPSGRTSDFGIEENTLRNEAVASCLKVLIRGWVLPFRPAESVPVMYPFVFTPASEGER